MWRALLFCCACDFTASAGVDADRPIDAPTDAPPDARARVRAGLIAFYTFDENGGPTIHDTAGVSPALDVTIKDTARVSWESGLLLMNETTTPVEIASAAGNRRLTDRCVATDAITVEVWVISNLASQTGTAGSPEESARVVTLVNSNPGGRNFAIGQRDTMWQGQARIYDPVTMTTEAQGNPPLRGGLVTQTFQHVVLTATASARTLFVDGVTVANDTAHPGTFDTWDPGYRLSFGNEVSLNNKWNGKLLMLAIYDRALTTEELALNHSLGPEAP